MALTAARTGEESIPVVAAAGFAAAVGKEPAAVGRYTAVDYNNQLAAAVVVEYTTVADLRVAAAVVAAAAGVEDTTLPRQPPSAAVAAVGVAVGCGVGAVVKARLRL